jgi:hypothetical protein
MSGQWSEESTDFLVKNYPLMGKVWCMEQLGMTDAQIRAKASRLKLKARGTSQAWKSAVAAHGDKLRGRKRPEQASVIRALHEQGKMKISDDGRKRLSDAAKERIASHGHPRGSLGLKHTEVAKQVIGLKSKAAWQRMTRSQRMAKKFKMMKSRSANGNYVGNAKHGNWKAAWREIGGKRNFYRSRWEANYARYLEWLKANNYIKDWQHEPKTFWFEGVKRGCVSYLPDFCVTDLNGFESYHEVKGWMDSRSKTKIKRMAKYHPDVKLVVIEGKAYKEIESKLGSLIPQWEKKGHQEQPVQTETDELNFPGGWMQEP